MQVWAIVVAAGTGTRFGGPKQLELLGEKRVIDWSCDAARRSVDGVTVVTSTDLLESLRSTLTVDKVVAGGKTRSASVRAGLASVPSAVDVIVVHDAARPLATDALFESVVSAIKEGADAAIPGVAVSDTIKRITAGLVETVDRSNLIAVQTPQAFRVDALREAHRGGSDASDDAGLIEAIGGKVVIVQGEPTNAKITTLHDLRILRSLVAGS